VRTPAINKQNDAELINVTAGMLKSLIDHAKHNNSLFTHISAQHQKPSN
jgi:hypothetical protein